MQIFFLRVNKSSLVHVLIQMECFSAMMKQNNSLESSEDLDETSLAVWAL